MNRSISVSYLLDREAGTVKSIHAMDTNIYRTHIISNVFTEEK